jgi:transposase-like protein
MGQTKSIERWSARKKEEAVLRLLASGNIQELARNLKVSVRDLENWKRSFLIAAREGLKSRGKDPLEKELEIAKRTIGDLTMELNLHKKKENFLKSGRINS